MLTITQLWLGFVMMAELVSVLTVSRVLVNLEDLAWDLSLNEEQCVRLPALHLRPRLLSPRASHSTTAWVECWAVNLQHRFITHLHPQYLKAFPCTMERATLSGSSPA